MNKTIEEIFQNLAQHPEVISRNELERLAIEAGVDFDDKSKQIEPEGYPDKFISESEQATNE